MDSIILEQHFDHADSLWEYLSAPSTLLNFGDEVMVYRGHACADWELVPTVLRDKSVDLLQEMFPRPMNCEDQAVVELNMLEEFIRGCDNAGVSVPNDSFRFRDTNLSGRNYRDYYEHPQSWPSDDLIETLAMARLHGLPTRLLDWTTDPYVAVYFAVSEALKKQSRWKKGHRIAIFKLNTGKSHDSHFSKVRVVGVRGAISQNLVMQKGLFTVYPILGGNGEPAVTKSLEHYLPPPPTSPIEKLTVPAKECVKLYELCGQLDYNAARLFPSADGASMFVDERILHTLARSALSQNS